MKAIVQDPHPALRTPSVEVPIMSIPSRAIQELISTMHETLATCDDGVALAAPQIGVNSRIFVVSPRVFPESELGNLVYINPIITKKSKSYSTLEEGCLSVRWRFGHIKRHNQVTVTAYDERGKPFTRGASGLLAQIFQHEIDHLDGILFTDTANDIHEYHPQ